MPTRRPASSPPKRKVGVAPRAHKPIIPATNPRRTGRQPAPRHNIESLCFVDGGKSLQGHTRNSSSGSSVSNSSSLHDGCSFATPKKHASSKYSRDFGFLTPATSPESSFNGCSEPMASLSSERFLELPTEVHQHICNYLDTDRDIANYAKLCTKTRDCVTSSVWRKRFLHHFDLIEYATPEELSTEYEERRRISQCNIEFHRGPHPLHQRCLSVLKDLIIQSDAQLFADPKGRSEIFGRNHDFIRQLVGGGTAYNLGTDGTNVVDAICRTDALFSIHAEKSNRSPRSLVLIVQLCLLHLSLDPFTCTTRAAKFYDSQQHAYQCYSEEPIFLGRNNEDINLTWLLHVANFFKFHLKQPGGEGMLTHMYKNLDGSERPRPWCGRLKTGTQQLGKCWKGAYAFLDGHDLAVIRDRTNNGRDLLVDETSEGNNGFQDLVLFFDIANHPELHFSKEMEEILHGRPHGALRDHLTGETSIPKTKDFFGLGYDGKHYHFNGRIHAMPPQQGIPGFQRVTMVKFLPDEDGIHGLGFTSAWAYEGCVLPGNEIMIGRWWRVESDPADQIPSYSGPFIFWGVESTAEDRAKDVTVAVKFMEAVAEAMIH